jgi:hypothetical protein
MNRAFSPEILVQESWAVGPGWNETGLWPYVTTASRLAKLQARAFRRVKHVRSNVLHGLESPCHLEPGEDSETR